ncbi:spermatogenesis-associated protein 9 isoform X2 [Chrysemys picta bellii]|uniref:spermatogenesis-associated protein 9 isoform X2 n=1 Tax=Chrysemys picta bellii TaxID=8478 RepID=UPI0032B28114
MIFFPDRIMPWAPRICRASIYLIQRAVVEIIDEIKDEFPTIIGLQQSNQEIVPILQASRSVVASAFSSSPGVRVINGLNTISTSSKSVAKVLQPQLVQNFAELNTMSHRLLKNVNIPKQPLYKNQGRTFSLFDVISYPAKTALTSIMCASYAALIYVRLVWPMYMAEGHCQHMAYITLVDVQLNEPLVLLTWLGPMMVSLE